MVWTCPEKTVATGSQHGALPIPCVPTDVIVGQFEKRKMNQRKEVPHHGHNAVLAMTINKTDQRHILPSVS